MRVETRTHARAAIAAAAGVLLVGALAAGASAGPCGVAIATLGIACGVAAGFAILGSVLEARARRAEVALVEERARAIRALAASELRRAEAEPLAVAGARAAAAAHDMSGPLAAIRAGLEWLEEALRGGRLSATDDEAGEVVADARASSEALLRALGELRRASEAARRASPAGGRASDRLPEAARPGE